MVRMKQVGILVSCSAVAMTALTGGGMNVARPVGRVVSGKPVVVDFGPQGEGGFPAVSVRRFSEPGARLRLSYSTHPDGLGERGDFWHETRATYMGPDVWLPIAPASTDRFDVFAVTNAGVLRAAKCQGLVRYVRVAVDTPGAEVDVENVMLENRGVHSEEPVLGAFSCSDDELTRIWQASVRTCLLASIPARGNETLAYVSDGAKRDRLVWSGDLWWAQRNAYVAFGPQSPYMTGSIDMLAENQTPAGYVNACPYPESRGPILTEAYGPFGSDEFAVWFVPVLADHYRYTGDRTLLVRRYPNVVKLMDYLSAYQNRDGLFNQRRETAKHSEGLAVGGTSLHHRTYMHILLWRAYGDAAFLASQMGRDDDRSRFAAMAQRLEKLLWTRFYDEKADRFVLSLEQPEAFAFVANAASLAFGLARGERAARILGQLARDKHGKFQMMAIRGAFENRDGGKALALLNAHNWRSVVRDDWEGCHLMSECMHLIRKGWGDESHPDTALAGVLTDYVLGVRPVKPGYRSFVVDPIAVPSVTWAKGRVPTPEGFIEVDWRMKNGRPDIRVIAPKGLMREEGDKTQRGQTPPSARK